MRLKVYSKIEKYKEKISKYFPGEKIYFGFYIEDITAIGNYIYKCDFSDYYSALKGGKVKCIMNNSHENRLFEQRLTKNSQEKSVKILRFF